VSAIDELAAELAKLPGIGRKTALRLTYHLLKRPADQNQRLASSLESLAARVHACPECFNLTEDAVCAICRDAAVGRRDATLLCVVEEASDIGAIERTGEYRGMYHVLGGRLSPLDGIGPDDLTLGALLARVTVDACPEEREGGSEEGEGEGEGEGEMGGTIREVILATNPNLEGEATALYVQRQLAATGVAVSRIARGLPVGGDLEYADGVTIAQALSARRAMP
jgi:recombination protein RecR